MTLSGIYSTQRLWIEGIGDLGGLFFPLQFTFEEAQLLTCFEDSNLFWNNPYLQGIDCFSLGIINDNKSKLNQISIFPNPAQNQITLILGRQFQTIKSLTIYNITGQKVLRLSNVKAREPIDISSLKAGIYLVEGILENGVSFAVKLVKE